MSEIVAFGLPCLRSLSGDFFVVVVIDCSCPLPAQKPKYMVLGLLQMFLACFAVVVIDFCLLPGQKMVLGLLQMILACFAVVVIDFSCPLPGQKPKQMVLGLLQMVLAWSLEMHSLRVSSLEGGKECLFWTISSRQRSWAHSSLMISFR